jgi:hypothetical protein
LTAKAMDLIREDHALHLATGFPHDPAFPVLHLGAIADIIDPDASGLGQIDCSENLQHILGFDHGSYAIANLATQLAFIPIIINAVHRYALPRQEQEIFQTYALEAASQFFLDFLRHLAPQDTLKMAAA